MSRFLYAPNPVSRFHVQDRFRDWASRWTWDVVPCTCALASGPVIATVYCLTGADDAQGAELSIAQMLRGVLCLMMVAFLFRMRRLCLLEHPLIRPLTLLAGYAILTAVLSANPQENIVFAVKLSFLGLVFASTFCLVEQRMCGKKWLAFCAGVVLIFMIMGQIVGLITGSTAASYGSAYATGGLTDRVSASASQMISTMPVILMSFPYHGLSVVGVAVLLGGVFFTMRRTELIAAVAAMCSVVIYSLRQKRDWGKVIVASMAITGLAWIGFRSPAGRDLIARFQDLDPSQGSGSGRYVFWRIAFDHIMNRGMDAQVLGEGVGAARDLMGREFGHDIGCHSDWLDMGYSFGVVGVVAIGWWYLAFLRFIIHLYRNRHPTFQGALSAFVLLGLISLGTGGAFDPAFVMIYAAIGFWAAQTPLKGHDAYAGCASR